VLLLVTAFPLVYVFGRRFRLFGGRPLQSLEGWGVLARAGVLMVGVMLGLVIGRRLGGVAGLVGLLVAQLLLVLTLPLIFGRHSPAPARETGRSLALGMIAFLVLHLAFAFAFTYPYTLAALRGAGLPILAIGAGFAILPAVFRAPRPTSRRPGPVNHRLVILFSATAVVVLIWSFPDPTAVREPGQVVRAATFNIHYGFNTDWEYLLEDQATAIENCRADIIFLQEVDAGRITSYGVDNALWLARRLGMQAVFAPTLEGLSGIALLTRLPVLESEWALLPSGLEQTAIVHARVALGHRPMDAYGVWLGLEPEERMNQVTAAMETIGKADLALLGGDMNSEPGSPVYRAIQAAGFGDPFVATGNLPAPTSPAVSPVRRIDYVWVRGLKPIRAQVFPSQASDHRLVVVELANR
jgi:endonuclease/exonuclease/phosphatase family metal-dependent hydrolase